MRADRRLLASLVALAALAGCGGDSSDAAADDPLPQQQETSAAAEGETTTTTTTTSTTEAPADPTEAAILADYRAGWDAFDQAMDPPDPDHPALRATSTGRALEQSRTYLGEIRGRGNVLRGGFELAPEIRERTADAAVIVDCVVDTAAEVPASSPEQAGTPKEIGWEVHMKLVGVTWMQEVLYETEAACAGR